MSSRRNDRTDAKRVALKIIERMPDDASLEDLMGALYVHQRLNRGLLELKEGETISHEAVQRAVRRGLRRGRRMDKGEL